MGVIVNFPLQLVDHLDKFYISNYGYDIQTHLCMYLWNEFQKIKDETVDVEVKDMPRPKIRKKRGDWIVVVIYPDNTSREIKANTLEQAFQIFMEWSKYSFKKECSLRVKQKIFPSMKIPKRHDLPPNINPAGNQYRIRKTVKTVYCSYGCYSSLEEAEQVRNFLEKKNWNIIYSRGENQDKSTLEYKNWLLQLSKNVE